MFESMGVTPDKEIVTYCRIGERAAHTWFVLKHILKYPSVRVYDGVGQSGATSWGPPWRNENCLERPFF